MCTYSVFPDPLPPHTHSLRSVVERCLSSTQSWSREMIRRPVTTPHSSPIMRRRRRRERGGENGEEEEEEGRDITDMGGYSEEVVAPPPPPPAAASSVATSSSQAETATGKYGTAHDSIYMYPSNPQYPLQNTNTKRLQ